MPCGPAIVEAIHRGSLAADELLAIARRDPAFCAMRDDAAAKLRAGTTTPAEVVSAMGAIWS